MIARAASAAASCACLAARATRRPRTSFARRLANMSAAWRDVKFGASGAPGVEVGDASAPAVCLLQEWWGVTLEIKAIGEKLHGVGRNCTRHETAFSVLWQRHLNGGRGRRSTAQLFLARLQPARASSLAHGFTRRADRSCTRMDACGHGWLHNSAGYRCGALQARAPGLALLTQSKRALAAVV